MKRYIMKVILPILLGLLFTIPVQAGYEGDGYASPEEAVGAYIQAFQENDLEKMVSTFAIETAAEQNCFEDNVPASYARFRYFPVSNDFARQMNKETRYSEVMTMIRYMYGTLAAPGFVKEYDTSLYDRTSLEEEDAEAFIDQYFSDGSFLNRITWKGEFIPLSALLSDYSGLEKVYDRLNSKYNGNEIRSCVGCLSINQVPMVLFTDTINYGGKWYLLSLRGTAGSFFGMSGITGGLMQAALLEKYYQPEQLIDVGQEEPDREYVLKYTATDYSIYGFSEDGWPVFRATPGYLMADETKYLFCYDKDGNFNITINDKYSSGSYSSELVYEDEKLIYVFNSSDNFEIEIALNCFDTQLPRLSEDFAIRLIENTDGSQYSEYSYNAAEKEWNIIHKGSTSYRETKKDYYGRVISSRSIIDGEEHYAQDYEFDGMRVLSYVQDGEKVQFDYEIENTESGEYYVWHSENQNTYLYSTEDGTPRYIIGVDPDSDDDTPVVKMEYHYYGE